MLRADTQASHNPSMGKPVLSLSPSPHSSLAICRESPFLLASVELGSIWCHVLENTACRIQLNL